MTNMTRCLVIDSEDVLVYTDSHREEVVMAKVSQAQLKAQAKYDAEHTQGVYLKLNTKTDKDIIEQLNMVANRQGYIKELIRNDMKKTV